MMKIGDRVRVSEEGNHFGKEGTVKKIDVFNLDLVCVEFRDGYFICGIKTKRGWYTYHYQNAFWDYFKVPEVDRAPEWDGHTSYDVTRLLSLEAE